jgi:hypothetical protein
MKTNNLMSLIRLAALASLSLLPGMAACTYSATSPVVGSGGGYVSVYVYTQPGCAWQLDGGSFASAVSSRSGSGSGAVTLYVAPNSTRSARYSYFNGFTPGGYVQTNYIPGRSGVVGGGPVLVFRTVVTEYGR